MQTRRSSISAVHQQQQHRRASVLRKKAAATTCEKPEHMDDEEELMLADAENVAPPSEAAAAPQVAKRRSMAPPLSANNRRRESSKGAQQVAKKQKPRVGANSRPSHQVNVDDLHAGDNCEVSSGGGDNCEVINGDATGSDKVNNGGGINGEVDSGEDLCRLVLRASAQSVELKRLLQGDSGGCSLVGREAEQLELERFLRGEAAHCALYVCGPPGSGKSAAVTAVSRKLEREFAAAVAAANGDSCHGHQLLLHNCMETGSSARTLAARLAQLVDAAGQPAATPTTTKTTPSSAAGAGAGQLKAAEAAVRRALAAGRSLALVLDEIDQVDVASLRRLLRWPELLGGGGSGSLRVLGVANSLALCDRLYPDGRPGCLGQLAFAPYTRAQLADIVAARLGPAAAAEAADAVRLAAGRVAASTGDARRVLEVCRRSVELADGSPSMRHVGEALRSNTTTASSSSTTLPLQLRLTAAAALRLRRRGHRQVTLGELDTGLRELCAARRMPPPPSEELPSICQSLHDMGVLRLAPAAEPRASKVALRVDDRAVEALVADPVLLAEESLR